MHFLGCVLAAVVVFAASTGAAFAQDTVEPATLPSSSNPLVTQQLLTVPELSAPDLARDAELTRWMDEFARWQTWSAEWRNRRERGWFSGFRERRVKPAPPAWLPSQCEITIDIASALSQACTLLAEWSEDPDTTQVRRMRAAAMTQGEEPTKTVWWEHVHLDVLWPAMQWRASTYGVVGTHVTANVKGRLQVFLAPGAMFLNVPTSNGGRAWKVATNYGIGYSLFDFTFPGNRRATLNVNLAKAWLLSDKADLVSRSSVDFVGFSMTFKQP
jgi:hypothetical protein